MALIHWLWGIGEKKVCAPERESFWRIVIFQEIFLVLILALVVVKKGFLGHRNQPLIFPQQFQSIFSIFSSPPPPHKFFVKFNEFKRVPDEF